MTDLVFMEYLYGSHRPLPVGWPCTAGALTAALEPVPDGMELAWLCTEWHNIPAELAYWWFGVGLRVVKGWFCPEDPECAGRLRKDLPFHYSGFSLHRVGKHCHRALSLHVNWEPSKFSQPLQTVGDLKDCLRRMPARAPVFAPDRNHVHSAEYDALLIPEYDITNWCDIPSCDPVDDRVGLFLGQDVQGKEYLFLRTSYTREDGWS